EPGQHSRPEGALAVLIQTDHSGSKTTIVTVALDAAILNRAEFPGGQRQPASPYRAFTILEEPINTLSSKLRVLSELAVLPTCKPLRCADPKSPVPRDEQAPDLAGGKRLIRWRLPGDSPYAIEAKQAELRTQPQIAVLSLGNRADGAFGKA